MKTKQLRFFTLIFLFPILLFSQEQNFWNRIDKSKIDQSTLLKAEAKIQKFETYTLQLSALKTAISEAPFRNTGANSQVQLDFPIGDTFKNFNLYKVHTLSPVLSEKYPSIQSFVGVSDKKNYRIRITLTKQGLFGFVSTPNGKIYINPYTKSRKTYQVFARKDAMRTSGFMECLVDEPNPNIYQRPENTTLANVNDGQLRTYRIAVSTTGEYAQFHVNQAGVSNGTTAQQKTAVLSAITVSIDRVNDVFEIDFGVTLSLVDNEDSIIFLNGYNDPFQNNNPVSILDQNQTTIDAYIGSANYDIGHNFSTGSGGLALLGVVCVPSYKAYGTTGIGSPIGDPFDIDYVAHEIGHEFGADHTFNGNTGSCSGNANGTTSVEPGSGSTIMGYASLCPGQNVQEHSDPYFSFISIDQVYNNIAFGNASSCPVETSTGNSEPTVSSLQNHTIPTKTAFKLTAEATDPDNDALTYCWEQSDTGFNNEPPTPFENVGAVFRSRLPDTSPTRYFPQKASVLQGDLTPTWEVIPNVPRTLHFAVTVRDNNPNGGQSARRDMTVNVVGGGPFKVTSQNSSSISYDQNINFEVTWDVSGTDGNGINTSKVNILLSYDGGTTFTKTLASSTANDGSEMVATPIGTFSSNCRIMVEADGNVFYAVNSKAFAITDVFGVKDQKVSLFSLYPNPTQNSVNISLANPTQGIYHADIYDLTGKLVKKATIDTSVSSTKRINIQDLASGIYLVKIGNTKQQSVEKLIIN